jgi:hypothetical protein
MATNVKHAPQRNLKTASEVRNVAVSLASVLDSGELLTGTPTVTEVTTSALTFSNEGVSTGSLTINGVSVTTGEAVQFKVTGGTANTDYEIQIVCATDATPAQTLYSIIQLGVLSDT